MKPAAPTVPSDREPFAIILFGLECIATRTVVDELVAAGIAVNLICMPGRPSIPILKHSPRRSLPVMAGGNNGSVLERANQCGIDLWRIGDLDAPEVRVSLREVEADLVVVACYTRLIPASLFAERRFGGVNLHPSLLPDKRGPDPLFWVFRNNDTYVGSTVHQLSARFDSGSVIAHSTHIRRSGMSEDDLDQQLARLGAQLLIDAITRMQAGSLEPTPQSENTATWARHPHQSEFVLDTNWTAEHAANFFHGIKGRGHPITVDHDGQRLRIMAVHGWTTRIAGRPRLPSSATAIRCSDGWLLATLTAFPASPPSSESVTLRIMSIKGECET